jgi:hypothetical protein
MRIYAFYLRLTLVIHRLVRKNAILIVTGSINSGFDRILELILSSNNES